MPHPLLELRRLGQSPWHDNIHRELLTSGKLAAMIADGDITGLTSNPTIFEQAIAKSSDYDADLERLARAGKSAAEIFDQLSIDDIRNACDLFAGVYRESGGKDGFCSIEVGPRHANDTQTTIREAKRLWETVDRPNLMVKIPATREGVPAIEESIAAGININVTLIFSLERYEEVMDAHIRGLIRRAEASQPVDRIASVASFFVSRVDTAVDKLLDEKIAAGGDRATLDALKGKAAIANAKLANQAFRRKTSTEAWGGLAALGAQLQRPLWASTSTKNPEYPDVYYVEAFVGPDSVDTMPPATLAAYKDHGSPAIRIEDDLGGAHQVMSDLAAAGIDMTAVTKKLEEDGVASFTKSFDSLLAVVEERRVKAVASAPARKPAARKKAAPAARKPAKKAVAAKKAKAVKKAPPARKGPAKKRTIKRTKARIVARAKATVRAVKKTRPKTRVKALVRKAKQKVAKLKRTARVVVRAAKRKKPAAKKIRRPASAARKKRR